MLDNDPNLLSDKGRGNSQREVRSLLPWIAAAVVVVLVVAGLIVWGGQKKTPPQPGGSQLAVADAYAASLPLSNLAMSESANLAGGKVTYIDGVVTNQGSKTVSAVTVQIAFHNVMNQLSQKDTMPLNLIRTREPYVDTQPVSATPIHPGEQREFRLILDHVTADWNQQYPELRVIEVR